MQVSSVLTTCRIQLMEDPADGESSALFTSKIIQHVQVYLYEYKVSSSFP